MAQTRIPDPTLMARLQLSVKGVDWAASLVAHRQHEQIDGEWSPHQHLFHLNATETIVYHARLERILREEVPVFSNWDSEAFVRDQYDAASPVMDLANAFVRNRERTVEIFKGLTEQQWLRRGAWPDGRNIDLAWLAEKALWHSLDHFATLLDLHGEMEPLQAPGWNT